MTTPIVWFRLNTGPWLPDGDPAILTGGIPLAPLAGLPLFLTVQGTGDASIVLNAGASPFVGSAPLGYTSGLPSGAGFTTLDPTKRYGSGTLSGGNLDASFPTIPGMIQSVDGYTSGKLYCEIGPAGGDIFSAFWGGGFGRDFAAGGDFNQWFDGGFSSGVDPNGGALVGGQTLSNNESSLFALTQTVLANAFNFRKQTTDVVGIALYLSGSPVSLEATLADLFFAATPSFVDFTSVANRRQFINVNGGAQNIKPDGSGPYAVTPPVFLSLEGVAPNPDTFAINKGRGGNFTLTGPDLTAGATNPPSTEFTVTTPTGTVPFTGVLGDYQNGNIYAFNPDTLTDNGAPRKWLRRWRALPGDTTSAVSFAYLNLNLETGTEIPPGSNPQLVLRWSDDGGKTWSGNRIIAVGATGETAFTVKANRLGSTSRFSASTRIFELSSTDPFKVSIISAEVLVK